MNTISEVRELRQVLESVERQIGWHGDGPLSHDQFYCEHCKAAPALDSKDIDHFHDCLVLFVRRALATPSPQAPHEQSNAFSTTSAREQSSATASDNPSVSKGAPFETFQVQMDRMVGTYRVMVVPVPSPFQEVQQIAQEQCDQAWFIEQAISEKLEREK